MPIESVKAYIVSTVAHADWPDDWPELLDALVACLGSGADATHGAMQILVEFIKDDLTEDQLLPVLRTLMPALLEILGHPEARAQFKLIFV